MTKKMTLLVIFLGPFLGWCAGHVSTERACEQHNPQMNLKHTPLDCKP